MNGETLNRFEIVRGLGDIFQREGFVLYFVGGCVRDLVLNINAKDIDLATNAHQDKIFELADEWADSVHDMGGDFETVGAMKNGEKFEITPFRGGSLIEDLRNRDFGLNAIAISALPNSWLEFSDPFSGIMDIRAKVLSTPDGTSSSIDNDPLRILRAARFYGNLGFTKIDNGLLTAIKNNLANIPLLPQERVQAEIIKIMASEKPAECIVFLDYIGALEFIFPRMDQDKEFMLNSRHKLFWHLLDTLRKVANESQDPELRLAAFLHDSGKFSLDKEHAGITAESIKIMLRKIKFSENSIARITGFIKRHMDITPDLAGDDRSSRRFLNLVGNEWPNHIILRRCNDAADGGSKRNPGYLDEITEKFRQMARDTERPVIQPRFPVRGEDLMYHFKLKPSPLIGRMLNYVKDLYMDGQILPNEKFKALALIAKEFNIE